MATPFDLKELSFPEGSEIPGLLEQCPDIDALRFSDEEYLVKEGEEGDSIYLLLRGSVLVEKGIAAPGAPRSNAVAVITCKPESPAFIGEMAYFGAGARTASVKSAAASYALRLTSAHLDTLIEHFPALTRIICRQFTRRLSEMNQAVEKYRAQMTMNMEQVIKSPGETVFTAGAPADVLYQLVDGTVTLTEGAEVVTLTQDSGHMGFIEPGPFFAGKQRLTTCAAKTPAILIAFSKDTMAGVARNFPELLLDLYKGRA